MQDSFFRRTIPDQFQAQFRELQKLRSQQESHHANNNVNRAVHSHSKEKTTAGALRKQPAVVSVIFACLGQNVNFPPICQNLGS